MQQILCILLATNIKALFQYSIPTHVAFLSLDLGYRAGNVLKSNIQYEMRSFVSLSDTILQQSTTLYFKCHTLGDVI